MLKKVDSCSGLLVRIARSLSATARFRSAKNRALIVRPGGMGDLIMLCIAAENLGLNPKDFDWIIEKRSEIWARYLGLSYLCYDREFLQANLLNLGRYSKVINSEQLYGLSQVSAVLNSRGRESLVSFSTNRQSSFAGTIVDYDYRAGHEAVEFQKLLAAGLNLDRSRICKPIRKRQREAGSAVIIGLAGTGIPSRSFSRDWWVRQALRIKAENYLICCTPADRAFAAEIKNCLPDSEVFSGSFTEMCEQVKSAMRLLTVDGGFVHIGSYFGIPATVFFTSGIRTKWEPLGEGSISVSRNDLVCQPCTLFGQVPACAYDYQCKDI